ncbi:PREDICTED: protein EARLY FLOWERING 3-like [Tarenaya hassleriana]|uniref:protein EARLY FLOWERING 3-like n=1 Tax=Tarenaya hassleriana TaxID=28532 RepID=UPI00053C9FF3|nr:PREDICTED: protein EARLY FLOWERING 3-like [Tarenaya hassleriana]
MKRGKDDEKIMEPLFPRLHVKDADKGGPRAPPRNKMALYEQLSIPSQRFNHQGMLPPGPSNQARGMERNRYFHHQVSSSTFMWPVGKFVSQNPCVANMRSLARHDQTEMAGEEDDFMVPVFLNSGRANSHGMDGEKLSPVVAASCPRSVEIQEANLEDLEDGSLSAGSRQDGRDPGKENPRQGTAKKPLDVVAREETNVSKSVSKCDRGNNALSRQESGNRLDQDDGEKGTDISQLRGESRSGKGHSSPDEVDNDHDRCVRSRACMSSQPRNGEASDGISETSMVDSISSEDISPDDMVGIIGQKRFWKARKAISNQQRVFAVQVFELHRLVKVQRLMAASPHLLLDDGTYLGKSSPKNSLVKKRFPGEYNLQPPLSCIATKCRDNFEKDNRQEMECSAENAVGKTTSVSSCKNHKDDSDPPAAAIAATETEMTTTGCNGGLWCFPPQPHQWLVPVMSPSEGLVYKPYSSPGIVGSGCGGYYSRFMPAPMAVSNFIGGGPVCGIPGFPAPQPYHPGIGFSGYFPPYSGPTVNPNFSGHLEDVQQQSSCNFPTAAAQPQPQSSCNFPNAATPPQPRPLVTKPRPWNRESSRVMQGRSGSGPGSGMSRSALPLVRAAENSRGNERLLAATRVIKVVPHNPKAASESAARIFRSIQEERKQQEESSV